MGSCPLPVAHMHKFLPTVDFLLDSADTRGGGDGPIGFTGVLSWDLLEVPSPGSSVETARFL